MLRISYVFIGFNLRKMTDKKKHYRTIYIDPPWPEIGGGKIKRGADRHYPVMTVKEILALPIQHLVDPEGCHLYLWSTNNYLEAAFQCLRQWEFEYITMISWFKSGKIGLGQYFRGCTEHCLYATTKNRLPYKIIDGRRQQGVTGFTAARQGHSVKPEEMRKMIETVSYEPRLELFARNEYIGWDVAGFDVDVPLEEIFGKQMEPS